jgi:hypothetical protein
MSILFGSSLKMITKQELLENSLLGYPHPLLLQCNIFLTYNIYYPTKSTEAYTREKAPGGLRTGKIY